MAEVYEFDPNRKKKESERTSGAGKPGTKSGTAGAAEKETWEGRLSVLDIGSCALAWYDMVLFGENENIDRYALRQAQIYFPEMGKIMKLAYSDESNTGKGKKTLSKKQENALRELREAGDAIYMDALVSQDRLDEDLEELGVTYLNTRKLFPNYKHRTRELTEKESRELEELLNEEEDKKDKQEKMDAVMADLADELDIQKADIVDAMASFLEHDNDNEEDEELWEETKECLAGLHLLPDEDLQDPGEKGRDPEVKRRLEEEFDGVDEYIEGIEQELGTPDNSPEAIGERLLDVVRSMNPDIIQYFIYRYRKEIASREAEILGAREAKKKGYRGERAVQYIQRKEDRAAAKIDEKYDEDLLVFFRGLDAVERLVYRSIDADRDGILPEDMTEESFAWHMAFFCVYMAVLSGLLHDFYGAGSKEDE